MAEWGDAGMKRLTMNQVAKASLKHNRKAYFSLAIGIFLAVYLACTAVLCIYGTLEAKNEQAARKVGWADTTLLNAPGVTDDQLRSSGYFDQLGRVYVTAAVNEQEVFIGHYDETAEKLLYRRCIEGRMPESIGEIAAERSALDKLELENAKVGDEFTFTLKPFGGAPEERTFTLVGILAEQTPYLDHTWINFAEGTGKFPAILTHPDEPVCQYGFLVVHRIMTNRPGVTLTKIQADENLYQLKNAAQISRVSGQLTPFDNRTNDIDEQVNQVVLYLILGSALLLSACVAISSSMESMLAQKTEDIGMLRAVGATKKQIKRLFGRDSWILTLSALPVGAMLGCLTVWLMSCLMPNELLFRPVPWLLIPVILISFLCVFLSSMLPLRRASRQLPMGVLRDTDTLRKAKKFRSQKQFKATQLIAYRQFRLHPMRQAGSACMVALMLFVMILLGEMLLNADWSALNDQEAFTLSASDRIVIKYEPFAMAQQENTALTQNDMAQLRSLPMVDGITTQLQTRAILLLPDEVPAYFKTQMLPIHFDSDHTGSININAWGGGVDTRYLEVTEETTQADFEDEWDYRETVDPFIQMRSLQKVLGIQQKFVPVDIVVATLDEEYFAKIIEDGDIDLAALDAGQEVLVYAPNMYAKDHGGGSVTNSNNPNDEGKLQWDVVIRNDYFYIGQQLPLMQLFGETPDWFNNRTDEGQLERYYSELEQASFTPKVGAVIKNQIRIGNSMPFGLRIITTEKGAQALGLNSNGMDSVGITLAADPDTATEELLENTIRRIGMRRNMNVTNHLADRREERAYQTQLMSLFGGMVLLFFAVSVSMQVTNTSRCIRADERMVGTLRAVGADERALLSCYRLPTIMAAATGVVLAAIAYLLMYFLYPFGFPQYHLWLLGIAVVMASLNALCAIMGVRGQLRRVVNKSIIENIREL